MVATSSAFGVLVDKPITLALAAVILDDNFRRAISFSPMVKLKSLCWYTFSTLTTCPPDVEIDDPARTLMYSGSILKN